MSQLSLGFEALYMCSHSMDAIERAVDCRTDMRSVRVKRYANQLQYVERKKTTLFSRHYLRNRSTSDIGVFGYISLF